MILTHVGPSGLMLRTLTLTLSQREREYPVATTTPRWLPARGPRFLGFEA